MYEINTHNLKIYLIVLSLIFFLTNGLPLLHMFDTDTQKNINNINNYQGNRNYDNLKGDNFIMVNNNFYTLNATVIKHSIMYNTNTEYFTGSVILEYKNYIDKHNYCKIDIDIKEQRRNDIIYEFIYKYYNLSKDNIQLYCNNNECIHKLYKYENDKYEYGILEEIICNILTIKQLNDEL
jgi:hypothetical protein